MRRKVEVCVGVELLLDGDVAGSLEGMRLFAALPLPDVAVARLMSLRLRLSGPKDGLRWSEPEQWHITMQFYGEVSDGVAACLQAGLSQLTAKAMPIVLEGLGLFAAKGILLATVEGSPALLELHAQVLRVGAACGLVPESRPFRPHVTLARSKGKPGYKTLQAMSTPALPAFGSPLRWVADECLLVQSTLRPQGAEYTAISRVALAHDSQPAGGSS